MNISSIPGALRAAAAVALVACSSGGCYLLQSAHGQLELMAKRRPLAEVIDEPSTPPEVRSQLKAVAEIRDFATRELKLPDNGSYRSYADVKRPYVVWNVIAAPEFSITPRTFCYPIVGCVSYRGYFLERRARAFADAQRRAGLDVAVGGVAAYSTLGHFDDPILNTMMHWDDVELAAIIFHELTHQLLYIANDASFNEALATTVEEEGVRRWLERQGRQADLQAHLLEQAHDLQVIALLNATRDELKGIYASGLDPAAMRASKRRRFEDLSAAFAALRDGWGGHAPYEAWFKHEINNAHLASVATYYVCVPGFERELQVVNHDLPTFYARVRALAKLDRKTRDARVCGDSLSE